MSVLAGRRHLVTVGGLRIPSYIAMLYIGCVAGILTGAAVAPAAGITESRFAFLAIVLLAPALVGARLWYVLQNLARFRAEPRRLWRRGEGGAALYGGLVLGVGASGPVVAVAETPFGAFWDAASVAILVGLIVTRAGCLMNGCCAGRQTSGPLGMWLPNHRGEWRRRFPTPILEATWGAVLLGAALATRKAMPFPGALFAGVVGAYAAGRLALEFTREAENTRRANAAFSVALLTVSTTLWLAWGLR